MNPFIKSLVINLNSHKCSPFGNPKIWFVKEKVLHTVVFIIHLHTRENIESVQKEQHKKRIIIAIVLEPPFVYDDHLQWVLTLSVYMKIIWLIMPPFLWCVKRQRSNFNNLLMLRCYNFSSTCIMHNSFLLLEIKNYGFILQALAIFYVRLAIFFLHIRVNLFSGARKKMRSGKFFCSLFEA